MHCDLGYVLALLLFDNNLAGVVPDSICDLTRMSILFLEQNVLTGHIPGACVYLSTDKLCFLLLIRGVRSCGKI